MPNVQSDDPWNLLLQFICALFGAGLGAYIASRYTKKGEIDAMSASIDKVVEQAKATASAVEQIRTELSGGLWERQMRWRMKERIYVQLLESVDVVAVAYASALHRARTGVYATPEELIDIPTDSTRRLRSAMVRARIFTNPRVIEAWERAAEGDREFFGRNRPIADRLKANLDSYSRLLEELSELAKEDLAL